MRNTLALIIGAAAVLGTAPAMAAPRGDEPVAVPRAIKQGIDFVYVDPDMSNVARRHQRPQNWLQRLFSMDFSAGRSGAPNVLFGQLGRGLQQYQATYGRLPQIKIPAGPVLKRGSTGKRVQLLRQRLGLYPQGGYDDQLFQAVASYQTVHGIGPADGIAGKGTIASLNRGSRYYEQRIAINMERAFRLPSVRTFNRYVVVDSGSAEAYLFDRDRVVDGMKVVVGAPKTKTPMIAVIMRNAKANPYWNVPPELVRSLTAKKVQEMGLSYFKSFHYEVLRDWGPNAPVIDPKTVNWKAIASGKQEPTIHVRQLPGPWNSMRNMKFEMPNDYGIYLHDTPHDELFAKNDRWLSNGCVRLQDYRRFATWVFGRVPQPSTQYEQTFPLPRPVPIYLTYLTVAPSNNGVVFRPDPYGWDALAMSQMFAGKA
ncbi:L,D-transpeptidase family protein [Sphingomonas daechungensis]|uniref:L,D-transpeptidase family protein n=1 Tax=Sphingomonas daechungensis TaxID=1176646 RepID=A0ABX6T337_9SPHN|nr:L,D-transpeptidase family protein [Sphingomonas daechungensis]QNP43844.1 L,D-transpeptidase family protein [Sphingomonas daechungensis]